MGDHEDCVSYETGKYNYILIFIFENVHKWVSGDFSLSDYGSKPNNDARCFFFKPTLHFPASLITRLPITMNTSLYLAYTQMPKLGKRERTRSSTMQHERTSSLPTVQSITFQVSKRR